MVTILLIIIYAAFISLGLPDSIFGVSWPAAHIDFGVDIGFASLTTIIVGCGTTAMSMFAGRFIRRFGTGPVTAVSVLMTAVGLFGVSMCRTVWQTIPCMIMLGVGAGAVDVGLNDYVSAHYKARHMNWLHCFWGVGVTLSPLIMSGFLRDNSWRGGYRLVSFIQLGFALLLFVALPLWKKVAEAKPLQSPPPTVADAAVSPFRISGVLSAMCQLAVYCSFESILGTWGASFLVKTRGVDPATAAVWASMFYGGIMLGRFAGGFFSMRFSDRTLIRGGTIAMLSGAALLALPLGDVFMPIGLLLVGCGCGPVFPCTIHATAERFGSGHTADIIGFQMGGAYLGTLCLQPLFGFVASRTTFLITPFVLVALAAVLLGLFESLERRLRKQRATESKSAE